MFIPFFPRPSQKTEPFWLFSKLSLQLPLGWDSSRREVVEDRGVAFFLGCCSLSTWKSLPCATHPLSYCARMDFVFRCKNRNSNFLVNTISNSGRNCHWCAIFHLLWSCWDGDKGLLWPIEVFTVKVKGSLRPLRLHGSSQPAWVQGSWLQVIVIRKKNPYFTMAFTCCVF